MGKSFYVVVYRDDGEFIWEFAALSGAMSCYVDFVNANEKASLTNVDPCNVLARQTWMK